VAKCKISSDLRTIRLEGDLRYITIAKVVDFLYRRIEEIFTEAAVAQNIFVEVRVARMRNSTKQRRSISSKFSNGSKI